ncbi:unnamed protein product [Dimorphilus gyrociliatus]|uniref:Uncharacterized protein n=1 Tax=Dimorphilus gyrociliatus TaxID=2664684 RepID=A0A7I8WF29_9ANNE|nr:unnamed protein product [Dimorphilus gyrociliatus]
MKKYSGKCSQNMKLTIRNSQAHLLKFQFFDDTKYNLSSFEDGICNCLISTVCLEEKDSSKNCIDTGQKSHNQIYDLSGEISVLSNKLPLIQISYGDLDDSEEYAKHVIGPLACTLPRIEVIAPSGCFGSLFALRGKDTHTCVQFQISTLSLLLDYTENFKISAKFIHSLSIISYMKTEDSQLRLCNEIRNQTFICEQY